MGEDHTARDTWKYYTRWFKRESPTTHAQTCNLRFMNIYIRSYKNRDLLDQRRKYWIKLRNTILSRLRDRGDRVGRKTDKWEEALVVLRRAWTEEHGLLKKTRFSQNTLRSMGKENGEIYPNEQVWKDVVRAAGFAGSIIWDQTLREVTSHPTRKNSSLGFTSYWGTGLITDFYYYVIKLCWAFEII